MTDPKEVAAKDFEAEALALVEKWARDGSLGAKRTPAGTAVFLASGPVAAALRGAYAEASSELERVKGERDQALEAEDEAKACFWAIYPEWLELSGKPGITTEAAQTALASIQAKGE